MSVLHAAGRDQFLFGIEAVAGGGAAPAFRAAGLADIAALQNEPVMRFPQKIGRDAGFEAALDVQHGFAARQAGAVGEAEGVRVDRDGGLAEGDVEDDGGGFAADSGQGFERFAVGGDFAAEAVHQGLGEGDDVLCLVPPETDGADVLADLLDAEFRHFGRSGRDGEESRGDAVDGGVGGLGGEGRGDEELERGFEFQLGCGVGPGASEVCEEAGDLRFRHVARGVGGAVRRVGGGFGFAF